MKNCTKTFKRLWHLARHKKTVHGKFELSCKLCQNNTDKTTQGDAKKGNFKGVFKRADNLRYHIVKVHLTYCRKGVGERLVDSSGHLKEGAETKLESLGWTKYWRNIVSGHTKRGRGGDADVSATAKEEKGL